MKKTASFEVSPAIAQLTPKERKIGFAVAGVVGLFTMAAFILLASNAAAMRDLPSFVASLIAAVVSVIVALLSWNKFSKSEHTHIDESVEQMRSVIEEACIGSGIPEEDRQWILESAWDMFCGDITHEKWDCSQPKVDEAGNPSSVYILHGVLKGKTGSFDLFECS